MNSAIRIEQLSKSYSSPAGGTLQILDVPEFHVPQGDLVALTGESGQGKTTLLHVIAGIVRPDRGSVIVDGTEITGLSEGALDAFRARSIGYVFQTFNLLQGFSALENVEIAMRFAGRLDRGYARGLLRRVGLESRMDFKPRELSWGQQQRVAVARAMANRPKLVLADEPTGSLDAARGREAMELIMEFCREGGATLLLVTHDPAVAAMLPRVEHLGSINRAGRAGVAPG